MLNLKKKKQPEKAVSKSNEDKKNKKNRKKMR